MNLIEKSIEIIKANQSENGAYVASPNFETYNYSWFRDGAYIAYSMTLVGEYDSAKKFHQWCSEVMGRYKDLSDNIVDRIKKGETLNETQFLPTRFNLEGRAVEDEWTNFQTDGFGTWLWSLGQYIEKTDDKAFLEAITPSVITCIDYLLAVWKVPCYDCWEEHLEYIHTYTLGSIYAGLGAMLIHFPNKATEIISVQDEIMLFIHKKLMKQQQLIKMLHVKGEVNDKTLGVDASLLGMFVPYNMFALDSEVVKRTIAKIEQDIYRPNGGVYRYMEDTYYGGGEWILLACWLGWYYAKNNQADKVTDIINWVENQFDSEGQLPEQNIDNVFDEEKRIEWENRWGKNAKPLLWSHAMYIILKQYS